MEQPNAVEAALCEKELKLAHPQLSLRWNPQALLVTPGVYDVYGKLTPPKYDGRYQVITTGKLDGIETIIFTVTDEDDPTKPYRAPGSWLVQYMSEWDAAERFFMESMKQVIEEEMRLRESEEQRLLEKGDEEMHRFAVEHGAKELIGIGADFTH